MSEQQTYETIEAYLNGLLTGADLADFEQQLQNNPDLAAQVKFFEQMDTALSDKGALNFQKMVQAEGGIFYKKSTHTPSAKIRNIGNTRKWWSVAASFFVIILGALLLWKIQSDSPSPDDLFAQYMDTYALSEGKRGDDSLNLFKQGIQQYQAKDFTAAAQTFEKLVATDAQDMYLQFSLANAYFNQNPPQLALAQQFFKKVIADDTSIFVPKAKWYLGLILLKNGEVTEAQNLFKEVADSGGKVGKKAKELLEVLD